MIKCLWLGEEAIASILADPLHSESQRNSSYEAPTLTINFWIEIIHPAVIRSFVDSFPCLHHLLQSRLSDRGRCIFSWFFQIAATLSPLKSHLKVQLRFVDFGWFWYLVPTPFWWTSVSYPYPQPANGRASQRSSGSCPGTCGKVTEQLAWSKVAGFFLAMAIFVQYCGVFDHGVIVLINTI